MQRLNIGCDNDIRGGWINIDQFNIKPGVVKMDAQKLEFPDNSIDEICARDVLEHITWRKTDETLKEWYRVLKPGGRIYIQSPNLIGWALAIVHRKCGFHHAMEHIFAHQDNPGNFHYTGFSIEYLTEKMAKVGFKDFENLDEDRKIKKTDEDSNVHIWATK
jgi:ubiquinone/menaquinone biosynthesis C-methylase UbiE